jgi:hypothetical protein
MQPACRRYASIRVPAFKLDGGEEISPVVEVHRARHFKCSRPVVRVIRMFTSSLRNGGNCGWRQHPERERIRNECTAFGRPPCNSLQLIQEEDRVVVAALTLPFRNGPVFPPPDGVFPIVADIRCPSHGFFIDLYPQPRTCRDVHEAVLVLEDSGILKIIVEFSALVVVNPQALFLNKRIRKARVQLKARRERNRSERTVNGDRDIICFRHGADPVSLTDTAGMRNIWLHDIDGSKLEKPFKIPT